MLSEHSVSTHWLESAPLVSLTQLMLSRRRRRRRRIRRPLSSRLSNVQYTSLCSDQTNSNSDSNSDWKLRSCLAEAQHN